MNTLSEMPSNLVYLVFFRELMKPSFICLSTKGSLKGSRIGWRRTRLRLPQQGFRHKDGFTALLLAPITNKVSDRSRRHADHKDP